MISMKRTPTSTSMSGASRHWSRFTMSSCFTIPCVGTTARRCSKEWFDLVLTEGWAYGDGAVALVGKRAMSAVSTGGSTNAFTPAGASRHVVGDFLLPFDQTVHLCGMTYLEPFVFHGSHRASDADISAHASAFRDRILSLRDSPGEGGG